MYKFKTLSAARLVVLAFAALPVSANAAGVGHSVQTPQAYYGGGANAAAAQGANLYAPSGIGNIANNASMNFAPGGGGSASFSGMTGNVNVQTNIDNTKVINSSSNVSVNETINGSNVAYGLDGANALNVINNNSSYDASVSAMFTGTAENLENEALAVALSMGQ
jgi:hypothetical protein